MEELSQEKVEKLRAQAADALDKAHYSDAIALLNSALYLRPSDPELHEMRADAYLSLCDVHSALLNYRRAVKLSKEEDGTGAVSSETVHRQQSLAKALDLRAIALLDEGSFSQVGS